MLEYVRAIEGKSDDERKRVIVDLLEKKGIPFQLEEYGGRRENIVISLGKGKKEILVVTHYDAVPGSPGANDNASTIAVVFDLLKRLKKYKPKNTIKFIIFGDEERCCKGSRAYVKKHGVKDITAVYNMELVGMGDGIGIWPVEKQTPGLRILKKTMDKLNIYYEEVGKLPMFYADYLPFREAGLADSHCITVAPKKDAVAIRQFAESPRLLVLLKFMLGKLTVPRMFKIYHSSDDKSIHLHESALKMTSDIMYHAIKDLDK